MGERDDTDSGSGDQLRNALLFGAVALAEAHAMARSDPVGESGEHLAGEVLEAHDAWIERFVGVQVDTDTGVSGDSEEHIGSSFERTTTGLQVWATSDEVGSRVECVSQQGPMNGAGRSDNRLAGESDDLDIDDVGHPPTDLDQCLDVLKTVVLGGVGVGAHLHVAVRCHQAGGSLRPFDDVVAAHLSRQRHHGIDGTEQIARAVLHSLGQEGLVEMRMRLHCGRQEQVASEIDGAVDVGTRHRVAHFRDHPVDDQHVAALLCHGSVNNRRLP